MSRTIGAADEIRQVVRYRLVGGETVISPPRVPGGLAGPYSQKAMKGTPMTVVLFVCVLTPNVIWPPLGRMGVLTSVSWKT